MSSTIGKCTKRWTGEGETSRNVLVEISENLLGLKKHVEKEWITRETWDNIEGLQKIILDPLNAETETEKIRLQA